MAPDAIAVAFPVDVTGPVRSALVVTVAAFPVTLPAMGLVTVKLPRVPTLVMLDPVTVLANVVPVKAAASAATPVNPDPSPTKALAVIVPSAVVFPLKNTLKASDLLPAAVPLPMTKAVLSVAKAVALQPVETEDPALLY